MLYKNIQQLRRIVVTTTLIAISFLCFTAVRNADAAPLGLTTNAVEAVNSTFTYQGVLTDNGSPANGIYDFRFQFQDAAGAVLGTYLANETAVSDGLFTATIPAANIFKGERRFLKVAARLHGEEAFVDIGDATEIQPAPYAMFANDAQNANHALTAETATNATTASSAQVANALTSGSETVVQVGNFGMFQGGTSQTMDFAARGTGLMEVTTAAGTDVGFVYLPVDVPSQIAGMSQKLKSLSFCYSGAANNTVGPIAGIDVIQVRQVNKMSESTLLNQTYPTYITKQNECVNVSADTPVEISGSMWIMFRVIVSNTPLQFGEVKLTFVNN